MDKEKIEEANCELRNYITKRKIKYTKLDRHDRAIDTLLQYIDELEKEKDELKNDLQNVLNQTLGAFEHNWCIDWNFTDLREKYGLEESREN